MKTAFRHKSNLRNCFYIFLLALSIFALQTANCSAQKRSAIFGIQFKPIFPVGFLGTGKQTVTVDSVNMKFDLALQSGWNFGMVIRKNFTNLLALETGINYVKRKYHLDCIDEDFEESSEFRIIGYEIPVSLLAYIRIGEYMYMNASLGMSADMYASNVESSGLYHVSLTVRNHTFQAAIIANLGWELRTTKSGYFYFGASLHRPFDYELTTRVNYKRPPKEVEVYQPLSGSYLTLDVRYFFPENPNKKKTGR